MPLRLFSRLFARRWEPCLIVEGTATIGYASVTVRRLMCERHINKPCKRRFIGESGHELSEFLHTRWKEQHSTPSRMVAGSPWVWQAPLPQMPDFALEVTYVSRLSSPYNGVASGDFTENTLIADPLEAMLEVLKSPDTCIQPASAK